MSSKTIYQGWNTLKYNLLIINKLYFDINTPQVVKKSDAGISSFAFIFILEYLIGN